MTAPRPWWPLHRDLLIRLVYGAARAPHHPPLHSHGRQGQQSCCCCWLLASTWARQCGRGEWRTSGTAGHLPCTARGEARRARGRRSARAGGHHGHAPTPGGRQQAEVPHWTPGGPKAGGSGGRGGSAQDLPRTPRSVKGPHAYEAPCGAATGGTGVRAGRLRPWAGGVSSAGPMHQAGARGRQAPSRASQEPLPPHPSGRYLAPSRLEATYGAGVAAEARSRPVW